ncbi:hypothetical protein [Mycoplasmoides gallisepticum]|uniref:Uncharacterized protein n=2 Tax=Mycoplasmoides gallisepticum TaxID=2096 RepID=A0A3B0PN17_MYCGL|nr:hypothetical protein [Mycoplasmoides gallisepticum]SYV95014.1 Uncharacterised protein [Mycoplasmoides gallisepticum]
MQNIKAIENSLADYKDNPSYPTNSAILNVYVSDRGPTFNTYHATLDQINKYQASVQKEVAAQKAAEQTFNAIPTITGNNKGSVQTPQYQPKYNEIFNALLKTYGSGEQGGLYSDRDKYAYYDSFINDPKFVQTVNKYKEMFKKELEAGRGEFSNSL